MALSMWKLAAILVVGFSVAFRKRHGVSKMTEAKSTADTPTSSTRQDQQSQLALFINDNTLARCAKCDGLLIGNLVDGLVKREMTKSIEWDKASGVLTVKLKPEMGSQVYGQIASGSRVPLLWVVDSTFTATVSQDGHDTNVDLVGLHTELPLEGITTYESVLTEKIKTVGGSRFSGYKKGALFDENLLDDAKKYSDFCPGAGCDAYLERERTACKNYLHVPQTRAALLATNKKLSKVVQGTIGNSLISWDNWGSILFSMASGVPKVVTRLTFTGTEVVASSVENTGSPNWARYAPYSLLKKSQIIGAKAMTNCPSMLANQVARGAASGWGFGMLFGHGDPVVAAVLGAYPKANANNLVNLFTLCQKGDDASDPPCGGKDVGRIHWTTTVPADYL